LTLNREDFGGYFYCELVQKRDKQETAAHGWAVSLDQSRLLGKTSRLFYNVCNVQQKPAPGEPAMITFRDVTNHVS